MNSSCSTSLLALGIIGVFIWVILALICISLMTNDAEHPFLVLNYYLFFLMKYPNLLPIFKNWLVLFIEL